MDKTQRAELLRQRFNAIGRFPYVSKGLKPKIVDPPRATRTFRSLPYPDAWSTEGLEGWVKRPDAPKSKVVPKPKRRNAVSPLVRIAEQVGKSLPRVEWDRTQVKS